MLFRSAENPFNSLAVSANSIYIDEKISFPPSLRVSDILEVAGSFYPNWDSELAVGLLDYFSIHSGQLHPKLSKGMRSTFNFIVGIAARCPLTIFDEPTTGMDAGVRKDFYRALLRDYIRHPRNIILSSHLLNEVEDILEDILLISQGQKRLHLSVTDMKMYAVALRGKNDTIRELTSGKEVYHQKSVGQDTAYVVIKNDLSDESQKQLRKLGVEILPVAIDDLCVYLTAGNKGGIDDVFNRS